MEEDGLDPDEEEVEDGEEPYLQKPVLPWTLKKFRYVWVIFPHASMSCLGLETGCRIYSDIGVVRSPQAWVFASREV